MTDDLRNEHLLNRLRTELRNGGVKLWLPPFVENGNPNHKEIQILVEQYSSKLNLNLEQCRCSVLKMQKDALEKLEERNRLGQANLATLRIRCKSFLGNKSDVGSGHFVSHLKGNDPSYQTKIEIPLTASGHDLELAFLRALGNPDIQQSLKFICDGQVVKKDVSLQSQGITNSSKIMAIVLSCLKNGEEETESHYSVCDKTRSAVTTLLNCGDNDKFGHELEMENQQGCSLSLDSKDKKSLILAMTLHERGRAAMKRGNFPLALVLFTDADQQFKDCHSDVLKNADNIALLNLDIVWCYLCLRSVSHIADAEQRLRESEAQFERCYGKNLERVMTVKGTVGNEAALMARLHLLQGIVHFHQNKIDSALQLLEQTKSEIQSLKVSQEDINKVVQLGFSPSEALLGLRASLGNVDAAVEIIIKDREDRKATRKENAKKRALDRERRKLGKTADGSQFIEPENVQRLVSMGYDRDVAVSALKHSNNVISQAVFLIQEQPHLLTVKKKFVRPSNEAIAQFAALGFDIDTAYRALQKHAGNLERAADDLISNNGIIQCDPGSSFSGENEAEPEGQDDSTSTSMLEEKLRMEEEEDLRMAEATEELEKDLAVENDDYLNLTLEMEEQFLLEYLSVLQEASV